MTCREAIALLGEYLEATLDDGAARRLERHVDACDACTAYRNTYETTRALTARAMGVDMPEGTMVRVRAFLRAALRGA